MAKLVLDASAVLAIYLLETGADYVAAELQTASICSVNVTEVLATLADKGAPPHTLHMAEAMLKDLTVPFDFELARRAARLRPLTRKAGLSLGDRACLALAGRVGLPVLTADRAWAGLDLGVEIKVIR